MTRALLWSSLQLGPESAITVDRYNAVRVGAPGNDLRISGTADDLVRLAAALHEAAASIRETT